MCRGENKTLKPQWLSFPFSSPIKHIKILLSFNFSLPYSISPKIIPIKWPLKNFKYSLLWSKNSAIELHYSPQLKYKIQTKIWKTILDLLDKLLLIFITVIPLPPHSPHNAMRGSFLHNPVLVTSKHPSLKGQQINHLAWHYPKNNLKAVSAKKPNFSSYRL